MKTNVIINKELINLLSIIGFKKTAASMDKVYYGYNNNIVSITWDVWNTPLSKYVYSYRPANNMNDYSYETLEHFISLIKKEFKYELRKYKINKLINEKERQEK